MENTLPFRDTDYLVSPKGEIFRKGKRLYGWKNTKGYMKISIYQNGRVQYTASIHRMVCETHIPNPKNLPQINHIDGDKTNNDVSNLEWCNSFENIQHRIKVLRVGMDLNHKATKIPFSEVQILRWKRSINYPINYAEVSKKWGIRRDYLSKLITGKVRLYN